jgi:hypothetical protein
MAFIKQGSIVLSFAEYSNVLEADQRLFEANEGLSDDVVETHLIRSTERILTLIRATDWWVNLTGSDSISASPLVNATYILSRQNDFTDLCVYHAFATYILPSIADFGNEDNAERAKIGFYQTKFDQLFSELITAGDWYDLNADGTITASEKQAGQIALKRIR